MSRRVFILLILLVVAILVLVPLLLASHHRRALGRYRETLRASGHLMPLADLIPPPLTNLLNGGPASTNLMVRMDATMGSSL